MTQGEYDAIPGDSRGAEYRIREYAMPIYVGDESIGNATNARYRAPSTSGTGH